NELLQRWTHAIRTGGVYQVQARVKDKEGNYNWLLIRALPVVNDHDMIEQWFGTCTDIESQKEYEQRLQRVTQELAVANKEILSRNDKLTKINADLDNFIYTASHDLKAPITNREGLLSALLEVEEIKGQIHQ